MINVLAIGNSFSQDATVPYAEIVLHRAFAYETGSDRPNFVKYYKEQIKK